MSAARPTVVVTGASSGIGEAVAVRALASGFDVVGVSRSECSWVDTAPGPGRFDWVRCDVTSVDDLAEVTRFCEERGPVHGVVCAAGSGVFGAVEDTGAELVLQQLDVNYHGVVNTTRALLPVLRRSGSGRLVLIGSLAARAPIPFQAHYSASKAAVAAFGLALRNELHGTGIDVVLIEPGDFRTRFNDATRWVRPSSTYADRAGRVEAVVRRALDAAPAPTAVGKRVVSVLARRRPPRFRYSIGPDHTLVDVAARWFPTRLNAYLLRRHFHLNRAH